MKTLILSTLDEKTGYGYFDKMIDDPKYSKLLFIFNDDLDHFYPKGPRGGVNKNFLKKGWGTAVIRNYRGHRSEGIPTGYGYGEDNYFRYLDADIKMHINEALRRIIGTMDKYNYKHCILASMDGGLGHGVYKNINSNVSFYIMFRLSQIFDEITFSSSEKELNYALMF